MKARYQHYRNSIKTGDLILFAAKDIVSRAISWKTGSEISHAAMACWLKNPNGDERLYILESVAFGTTPSYMSNRVAWYLPHGDVFHHSMKPEYRKFGKQAASKLMDEVGQYYDYWDLFKQAFKRVTLDPGKLYCSEAVLYGWSDIINWNKNRSVPYPHQLLEILGVHEKERTKLDL